MKNLLLVLAFGVLSFGCGDDDGGTSASCSDVCDKVIELCGSALPACETACGAFSDAQRTCVVNSTSCTAIDTCGGSSDPDAGTTPDMTVNTTVITRCLGPSCPNGECTDEADCATKYSNVDITDNTFLCKSATGSNEFCLNYGSNESVAYDCSDANTVVTNTCGGMGCGYNTAPDDCVKCNGASTDCTF